MGVVIGLLILSVMMIVHELGHYLTGRKLGFEIEEFSIFMGPVLFSWRRNNIKYSLKLLPIGASVRFAGEYDDDHDLKKKNDNPGYFYNRPKWARAIVISTGPALNLLSGVLAFLIMFSSFGYTLPVIGEIADNTLAAAADLEVGDRILRANDQPIRTTLDYSGAEMFSSVDEPMTLLVRRSSGEKETVVLEPEWRESYRLGITIQMSQDQTSAVVNEVDPESNQGQPVLQPGDTLLAVNGVPFEETARFNEEIAQSGHQPLEIDIVRDGEHKTVTMTASQYLDPVPRGIYFESSQAFIPAVGQAFQWSWSIVKVTVRSIGMLFSGALRPQDTLAGPVGVVTMISDVVGQEQPLSEKVFQLLWMFALISVSLGFMNLLPIPPLDGNHLILIGVEAIRGKRLSVRTQNLIGIIGFALIIMLALAGLTFDLLRLTGR